MNEIKKTITVRELVEFILKNGSIDNRVISAYDLMQEGIRVHSAFARKKKREAKNLGCFYESEVKLSYITESEGFVLVTEGRADGIWHDINGEVSIVEIKSTLTPLDKISGNSTLHKAQAKCYAHMFLADVAKNIELEIDSINITVIYVHIDTAESVEFSETYTKVELEEFFNGIVEEYLVWIKTDYERKFSRDMATSIFHNLGLPVFHFITFFDFRQPKMKILVEN